MSFHIGSVCIERIGAKYFHLFNDILQNEIQELESDYVWKEAYELYSWTNYTAGLDHGSWRSQQMPFTGILKCRSIVQKCYTKAL